MLGHFVTVATGRSRFHAKDIIRSLAFDNYILCNGAAAFLAHQQVYKNLLDEEQLKAFVAGNKRVRDRYRICGNGYG